MNIIRIKTHAKRVVTKATGTATAIQVAKLKPVSVPYNLMKRTFVTFLYTNFNILIASTYSSKIPLKDRGAPEPISVPVPPILAA